ncbi:MAG: beta-galactosidase, partial [Treponema sp.]|nr:beta-galactosidase [Treponema sp.]
MNYRYDSKSLIRTAADGSSSRWFPVMGELHYSRCPDSDWKRELLKMKAGGVDIVSAYAIWIHHEEVEGEWDFSGWRNLRAFVERVGECGLTMILRIGPWCHGEVRNGGFPDWLLQKCPRNRCDDPTYLAEVQIFYAKLYEQVQGLLLKDGGPVIGVQIENEYGHCGGLSGAEGEAHMRTLTRLAQEAGFAVPLYTATGWGGAVTAGLLPVMGGYCEAPWDPRITEIEPSGNYLFSYERNDHAIGCDFGLGEGITFDMNEYPYLTAELGGGLQVTYKRRPVARAADIAAMSLAKLGSGCKLLGYYMYHGGMNPDGRLTTLEENKASGSLNDLPVKNYDFCAPLGEYGSMNGAYKAIRMLSLFLKEWGSQLCGMDAHIPADAPAHPEDYAALRTSWLYGGADGSCGMPLEPDAPANHMGDGKSAGKPGFLFVNNFQRRRDMAEHDGVALEIPAELGGGRMPELDVCNGDFFFLPVNMRLGGAVLQASACTPLTCLHSREGATYVFYTAARLACLSRGDRLYTASTVRSLQDADGRLYRFDRQYAAGEHTNGDIRIATLSR